MSRFATITLEVTVELEMDPGVNTPNAYELPYEYLAVRDVQHRSVEIHGSRAAVELISYGGADDLDPDSLLIDGVKDALLRTSGPEIDVPDEKEA